VESLVTTEWLAGELGADDLAIADASYFLPSHGRDAKAEFEAAHIPDAVFLDLATLCDADDPLPNMMPRPDAFAIRMQALGLGDDMRIVLYDDSPLHSAARAWFMLRAFGARQVAILDGGLAKWRSEGKAVESGPGSTRETQFMPARPERIVDKAFMLANSDTPVLDARSAERFAGGPPDAHGIPGGHIPGSAHLPYSRLFNEDGTWKRGEALKAEFDAAGIDPAQPFIATCGSGITANALLFGAHLLGHVTGQLYDGSWSEWGADPDTPKVSA
jgi:thiosulfate/3-mercaptopyruvate sulfurtransferase